VRKSERDIKSPPPTKQKFLYEKSFAGKRIFLFGADVARFNNRFAASFRLKKGLGGEHVPNRKCIFQPFYRFSRLSSNDEAPYIAKRSTQ
jgi:hypothetical protein